MIGLGYRREMSDWDMSAVQADFFEVAPENWVHRDRTPLHQLIASGRPVHLHGVSLNLGGSSPLDLAFLRAVRELMAVNSAVRAILSASWVLVPGIVGALLVGQPSMLPTAQLQHPPGRAIRSPPGPQCQRPAPGGTVAGGVLGLRPGFLQGPVSARARPRRVAVGRARRGARAVCDCRCGAGDRGRPARHARSVRRWRRGRWGFRRSRS